MTSVPAEPSAKRLVLRNTLISVGAQLVGTPLSILISAITARYLGASDYGSLYIAFMMTMVAFQLVEFGQGAVLAGDIARDRSRAGELLGASLAWRVLATLIACLGLWGACVVLGYTRQFELILALVVLQCFLQTLCNALQDTVRGFERTDVGALGQIGTQVLNLCLIVPFLLLGYGIHGVLIAQALSSAIVLLLVVRAVRTVALGRVAALPSTIWNLVKQGAPFLAFSIAMTLQPNVDAVFLSKLVPPDVVGWHAVARRLTGALVLPASLVVGALYPTLSRLYVSDRAGYADTARGALNATVVLAAPITLCCACYADLGIMIFSRGKYGAAQQNLIAVAPYLFLMYFSMPLGVTVLASGRQKAWAVVQAVCVVVSGALDPVLIPWFQQRYGNGGLGVAIAAGAGEVIVVAAGIWLGPSGLFNRSLLLSIARALAAGAMMAVVARLLTGVSSFVSAPIALATYLAGLWLLGGLGREQIALLRGALARKGAKA